MRNWFITAQWVFFAAISGFQLELYLFLRATELKIKLDFPANFIIISEGGACFFPLKILFASCYAQSSISLILSLLIEVKQSSTGRIGRQRAATIKARTK